MVPESYRLGSFSVSCRRVGLISATSISINVPLGQSLPNGYALDFGGLKLPDYSGRVGTGANQNP